MLKCLTTIPKGSTLRAQWKRKGSGAPDRDIVYSAWKHAAARNGRSWPSESTRIRMSTDLFLGLPTNVAGYAILAHLFAKVSGQKAVELICDLSNVHIYENQFDVVAEQLKRDPLPSPYFEVVGDIPEDLYGIRPEQLVLSDYQYHPALKVEMVV